MSFADKRYARHLRDKDLERYLGLKPHDPMREAVGGRRYSSQDVESLEEEKVPWLKRKRREYPR